MNSKRIAKIATILMIIATIAMACGMVFASSISVPEATNGGVGAISGTVSNVIGVVTYICYAASVILLVYLGIKFITSAPDAKADIKKMSITYVIGAVLVFAAGVILNVIRNLASSTITTGNAN